MQAKLPQQERHSEIADAAVAKRGRESESLLPVIQDVNARLGYVGADAIGVTADRLGISNAHAFGVASFYSMFSTTPRAERVIRVCDGPACALRGCDAVRSAIEAAARGEATIQVERTSCLGLCDRAPAALVELDPCGPIDPSSAKRLLDGWRGDTPSYAVPLPGEVRVAMSRVGKVDPQRIDHAINLGAYSSLGAALSRGPEEVLRSVLDSGLQGRGGAAFPTGRKWQVVADAASSPKYVVCNADESEPMAFKDRVLLEGDPHLLLEGMALTGYAIGADHGTIYIRGEYEFAARCLEHAIRQAEQRGMLGQQILGSDFSFAVELHRGAGAYICGEESALLESLEGRRGEPRIRPPYPTERGFRGQPTVANNVETLCSVPPIIARGATWYRSMGTEHSPGTKLFTVTGHVNRPGVFEVPFGVSLRQLIDRFAGGMLPDSVFKMALCGGAAGTIVDHSKLDVPLDSHSWQRGVSLGTGSVLVLDDSVSAVTLLEWLLRFFEIESCGKCTPCREGTRAARSILGRIRDGSTTPDEIAALRRLSAVMRHASLCGLGQSVSWPIDSAIECFRQEFTGAG